MSFVIVRLTWNLAALWQETVVGTVVVSSPGEVRHDGLFLTVDGIANLELSSKSIGQFEAFYNSVKVCFPSVKFARNVRAVTVSVIVVFKG